MNTTTLYSAEEIPAILTIPQLAEFLGIGVNQAYALARSDQLDVLHIGKLIRVPRHALLRYLGAEEPTNI